VHPTLRKYVSDRASERFVLHPGVRISVIGDKVEDEMAFVERIVRSGELNRPTTVLRDEL
jgi:hypothetical protein